MDITYIVIGAVVVSSIFGLLGGVLLLWREKFMRRVSNFLISFASGALFSVALTDLMPEALESGAPAERVFFIVLGGIVLFYLIERLLIWYHCHDENCDLHASRYLIIMGDFVHNAIDGTIIASSFLVSVKLGLLTTLAVVIHELPQEVADFGVLLHSGLSRLKVFLFNVISAAGSILGAALLLVFRNDIENHLYIFVALAAGAFLYIAGVDLLPMTHKQYKPTTNAFHALSFLFGIGIILFVRYIYSV